MWNFETFYAICFVIGVVYAAVGGLMAGVLGGDGDIGHDMDAGHDGIGGDLHDGDFSGTVHFSPMSPTIIATFLTFFGGSGFIYIEVFDIDPGMSLLPALATGIAVGVAMFLFFNYVYSHTQGGTEIDLSRLIGKEAEVITPIPSDGMGEIVYMTGMGRKNSPARSEKGEAIPKNSVVYISRIVGNVYLVRPQGDEPAEESGDDASSDSEGESPPE